MFDLTHLGSITDLHTNTTMSAEQLQSAVAARVTVLAASGAGRGDTIMIAHGGSPAFFIDLLATWVCGATAVCINPGVTATELECLVAFAQPELVLAPETMSVPPRARRLDPAALDSPAAVLAAPIVPFTEQDPVLILFTSGTTGDPKGVVHTAGSISRRIAENQRIIGTETLARSLCVLPTHFGHGLIGNCLTPLFAGQHLFLFSNPGLPGIARLSQLLDHHAITFMSSVPSFWKVALKAAMPPRLGSLKRVQVGSAPLSAELWQAIITWSGAEVCNLYGITETANWAAGACSGAFPLEDGLVGRMWGGAAAVRTAAGEIVSSGEGELLLQTPGMMAGYLHREDLTAAALADGWYHTGDWGTIDRAGVIRLSGRIKSEINRAGMKVLPEELDLLLERHPAVLEACAFGVPDPLLGEAVGIALRLSDPSLDISPFRAWTAERIRQECVPEHWFVVQEIPKTDRGKLNRERVRRFCMEGI